MKSLLLCISLSWTPFFLGQCCDYTLVGSDSYGDGWNGAYLNLSVNGVLVEGFTVFEEGSSFIFEVCDGETVDLEYFPGDYENENSWFLLGGAGNLIASDGPEPQVGATGTFVTDCNIQPDPGSSPCSAVLGSVGCIEIDNTTAPGFSYAPSCANFQGGDLWFTYVVPESGNLLFTTGNAGEMNDTGLAVWAGSSCTELEQLFCDDDSGPGYFSLIPAFNLEPGLILYIQMWGYGGQTGNVELCAIDPGAVELESSVLPILLLETNGETIVQEDKIMADLQVIYNGIGAENAISDPPTDYNGKIGIEIRGASSAGYPQRPFGFETRNVDGSNNNVELIEMPAENDWVLLSNFNDRSLIRNLLAQHIYMKMGNYAPRLTLCEVQLNGLYEGIYVFGEKIKRDAQRVDIATLNDNENTGDDVTGGYLLQLNYWNDENSWELSYNPPAHPTFDIHLRYEVPKPDAITQSQKDYIASFVDAMETSLYSNVFDDPVSGFRQFLDVESFIDYFLLNELSRNNDGFKKSRFFYKDKDSNGGKLKAGPPWDFDWAWKDLASCEIFESTEGAGWAHLINNCPTDNYSPEWYVRMLEDPSFGSHLRCRYDEYREDFLTEEYLSNYIDSLSNVLENAQARHYQRWPFLGIATASPELEPIPQTYEAEMEALKNWIWLRLDWLDINLPQSCQGIPDGLEDEMEWPARIYPNPSAGTFTIHNASNFIRIHGMDGRLVQSYALNGEESSFEFTLDQSGLFVCSYQSLGKVYYERLYVE